MSAVTLQQYETAERELSLRESLTGLRVHAVVILLVWAAVIPINIIVAPGFSWSVFVVAGTAIGVFFPLVRLPARGARHPPPPAADRTTRRRAVRSSQPRPSRGRAKPEDTRYPRAWRGPSEDAHAA
jgi:hypothetical protein